jgi:superfamily II DNA or RNA helicase
MPPNPDQDIRALQPHYRSGRASLANEFFAPCLKACSLYRRAAGYFSSSALVTWVAALPRLAQTSNVSIRLIASPQLSAEDVATLKTVSTPEQRLSYESIIVERILQDIIAFAQAPTDGRLRAHIFAWLVANKRMTIRFAFPTHTFEAGIFHEKIGVFDFPSGEQVAFTGSANETISGHERNYESIDVYRSWVPAEHERVQTKIDQFEEAWSNHAFGLSVHEISEGMLSRLRAVAPEEPSMPWDGPPPEVPPPPDDERRWRHQDEALAAFIARRAGILEMATGTGKTRTALKILSELIRRGDIEGAIITTDGTDLLSQWAEELDQWLPSSQHKYVIYRHFGPHHELGNFVLDPVRAILVISREQLGRALQRLSAAARARMIIIHDEVHGLGVPSLQRSLAGEHQSFAFRLGLSATPERAYDAEGNQFIETEIGPTVYRFPLEAAIARGVLCEFDYVPLEYHLTADDRDRLKQVFARQAARAKTGNPMSVEELWIELSRVYKTAEMKPLVFSRYLQRDPNVLENAIIFVETTEYGSRLLNIIHSFTHRYRTYYADDDREHLLEFARGAIDCLITCHKISQGIDIRVLKTVILFSAARAKLETIQRIGRCLRVDPTNPNKRARVIDFVRPADDDDGADPSLNADQERRAWLEELAQCRRETTDGP